MKDPFVKHPTSEMAAFKFHLLWGAGIGLLHMMGGAVMLWWHLAGALRHYRDRNL